MQNQLLSTENLRRISEQENKKGLNFESKYFPKVAKISEDIKSCDYEIKQKEKILSRNAYKILKKETEVKVIELKRMKEEQLIVDIECIRDNIISQNISFELNKISSIGTKELYIINKSIESFFILKQIQNNIKNAYNLKLPDRFEVLNQLKEVLNDSAPKVILVTDIEQFQETIPQDRVLSRLKNDGFLDPFSLEIISKILADYKIKSGNTTGLPRGVGISIYLAELFIKDIDNEIRLLPGVVSYSRFVDDIIISFSSSLNVQRDHLNELKAIVEGKFGLKLNEEKTSLIDLTKHNQRQMINYLGYKISFGGVEPVNIRLTDRKVDRYKERIDLTFNFYLNDAKINEKKARKIFVKRIRFLTGNTRLLNDGNVLAGIYFSNSLLNDISDLTILDQYLIHKLEALIRLPQLKNRLKSFSYKSGFLERKFFPFSITDLNKIREIWKDER